MLRCGVRALVVRSGACVVHSPPPQDTAGQERFRTITASYYRGAQGVILGLSFVALLVESLQLRSRNGSRTRETVYDVSNRESFEALPRWLEELENYVPPEVVKIVVGNKLDKVRAPARPFLPLPPSLPCPACAC